MSFVCNFILFFISHHATNMQEKKSLGSPSAEQISLSIAFLLRKRLIIMFQSDAAHCEICSPAISKKKMHSTGKLLLGLQLIQKITILTL